MTFAAPLALVLLAGLPWFWRVSGGRQGHARLALRAAAAALLVIALSGPQLYAGQAPWFVIFVVDHSDSAAGRVANDMRRVTEIGATLGADDRAGLVVFGENAVVERPLDRFRTVGTVSARVTSTATNLERALVTATAALPATGPRRIILASDGLQTTGDGERAAADLAARGIRLDVLRPLGHGDVRPLTVRSVTAPPLVRLGAPFVVAAVVEGPPRASVEVILSEGDAPATTRQEVLGDDGRAVVLYPMRATMRGTHVFEARAVTDDPLGLDATATTPGGTVVSVVDAPRVLRVTARAAAPPWPNVRDLRVTTATVAEVPGTAAALGHYDAVILDDVSPQQLTQAQAEAVVQFVEAQGGGLLTLGSAATLEPGLYANHPLERVLPVDLRPRAGQRTSELALVVAFDKSGSMDDRVDGVPRIEFARQAVHRVFDTVAPGDAVGVIAFDAVPHEILPLASQHTVEAVTARLQAVTPAGPTALGPALERARDWLRRTVTPAAKRHVLVVSDGRTSQADLARARDAIVGTGIQLSVVALGDDADRQALSALAGATGGRAYFPADVRALPAMVAREAARVAGGLRVDEPFMPRPADHPILVGLASPWPALTGYVVSAAKPGSMVLLRSHLDDPLLAAGYAGLGRVAVYTADLDGPWSAGVRRWPALAQALGQTIAWLSRRVRDDMIFVQTARVAGQLRVDIDTRAAGETTASTRAVDLTLSAPSGARRSWSLAPVAPGLHAIDIPMTERGPHTLAVSATDGTRDAHVVRGIYWVADHERTGSAPDVARLARMAALTGGRLLDVADKPLDEGRERAAVNVTPWCAAAALALFVLELLQPWQFWRRRQERTPRAGAPDAGVAA